MESYRLNELARHLLSLRKKLIHKIYYSNKNQKKIVFVAGVQRSGTNMLMDILERYMETDVYHERDKRAFVNYQMRGINVIHGLVNASSAPCIVIKSLCELQDIRDLLDEFSADNIESTRAIWVNRDYRDVVNSMLNSFGNQAEQVKRIAKYRDSDGWLSKGLSDDTYDLIREVVHSDISNASAAALIWYFRSIQYFEQHLDQDSRVRLIQYECIVSNPYTEFMQISNFLGLKHTEQATKKVHPGSVKRRPSPSIDMPIMKLCDELSSRFELASRDQISLIYEDEA